MTTQIIAIAGPIGAGKSTLACALAERLGDAATLHFDSYENLTHQSPDDLARWLHEGADFNALHIPRLRDDLAKLKRGEAITTPCDERVLPQKYVLFEMPLGREHAATSPLIDLLVWIDLPPEVALARKLHEFSTRVLREPAGTTAPHEFASWLRSYLESYLAVVRDVLSVQERRVRPRADVLIDGRVAPGTLVDQLTPAIRAALP